MRYLERDEDDFDPRWDAYDRAQGPARRRGWRRDRPTLTSVPEWYVRAVAGFLGLTMRVLNRGQHYEWKPATCCWSGGRRLAAPASTGCTPMRRRVKTLRELRKWLVEKPPSTAGAAVSQTGGISRSSPSPPK